MDWDWLAGLNGLTDIRFENVPINTDTLVKCKRLVELTLINCSVNDLSFVGHIKGLDTFIAFDMPHCDFSKLNNASQLDTLCLFNSSISDIQFLSGLSLGFLQLEDNAIKNINVLEEMTSCDTILLDNNMIEDISVFSRIKYHCSELSITDNRIQDISAILAEDTISSLYIQRNRLSKRDKKKLLNEFEQHRRWIEV
ncbi:hypothetical protein EDD70_2353 [Hydrogenoanaerobacterium saccharovorans]|uniref:Leucine Rich repeat-containing protein n=1 Tax=Hydrogenoanaerobacterium saccharovorans TaxID=474960 RepID=A0A1H8D0W2_9FIRM|nr:hypothetical protein [Hydrogenoanaerobacterium saccharovorans]RPF43389.1 hypothetical protein EDD70_2353 [Hydrogenoanaerobacterium saccharovorans]SEN00127.1 hypothetical protein SAMN05216180_2411 [Hydrogenoanaerobacterium saccharovorans]